MNPVIGITATTVPILLLLDAGLAHFRHFASLRDDLIGQHLVPKPLVSSVAGSLVMLEIGLGASGIVLWSVGARQPLTTIMVAVGILYLVFMAYSLFLVLRRPGASCGCSHLFMRINAFVPGRASLLALLAFLAAWRPATSESVDSSEEALFGVLAALSISLILRVLPATVDHPAPSAAASAIAR
jgi:hypothetical protein